MFVVTQYNSASLNQHIKNTYNFDMFSHGFVDILAAEQTPKSSKWFQGTADAVRQSMHHLRAHDHDYILVLSGDQLYQMDFGLLAEYHIEKEADLTIATIPVTDKDASAFGIMKVNAQDFIEDFTEKPGPELLPDWKSAVPQEYSSKGKHYLASMGIYIFKREFLERLFEENPDATDFGKEIIPIAIESGFRVASYAFDEYWTDIGTIRSFFEANIALTDNIPDFNLFDNDKTIYTRPRLLAPSKVFGTWFNKAIIAEGCIIHAKKIERAVVGIRSRIGEGTEISDAIVMGNDYYETMEDMQRVQQPMGIGKDCYIQYAIVDKNCRIGNNVTVQGSSKLEDTETNTYVVREGIIVLKKGAYLPDGTYIGP